MATKAQLQEQIDILKAQNTSLIESLQRLDKEYNALRDQKDIDPGDFSLLQQENEILRSKVFILEANCARTEKNLAYWKEIALTSCHPHNERNAGRKSKLSEDQVAEVLAMRASGLSYRKIAEQFNCSATTIRKVCSEINK